ncbi:unnamed protein product [Leptidea sinapis]|uniref:Uncharacterized protein n=1 Tax=Leptidea sinapis TaxID=189913 RepID=A0A5E4PWY3_9NEOP|nr:unnamed protein product [Leptidea sinapis]
MDEKIKLNDTHDSIYGNSCSPKDKVIILERELSNAQSRIVHLEELASRLELENEKLSNEVKEQRSIIADKEEQLNQIMALKLDGEQNQKSDLIEGKTSGRTLSDIISISEYDEQDLQMRRAEVLNQNANLSGAPFQIKDKTLNKTQPPDVVRPDMSSLNIDNNYHNMDAILTPRAESLPANFTPTPYNNNYKRNVNEMTMFGVSNTFGESAKHSTALNIPDNCSIYPNQAVSDTKNVCVEPKKINFSVEPSDNTHEDTSLKELGLNVDVRQQKHELFSQLKHIIKKSRSELETCKSDLKNAEDQLSEFPALKKEVEELKTLLENTLATMEKDKKFYEIQLSSKKALEQKLSELTQEVNEKSKDLNLLKEDISRRENMVLELAKEKRNLSGRISELETRIGDLQKRNLILERHESDNKQLKDKITALQKLEQLVSEKNQQIDSLNQHLDRLDNLQRLLNDKSEEADKLKEALEEKSNELFQLQNSVGALNRDITKIVEENNHLGVANKELKQKLTKLEKEQENTSIKLHDSESEVERLTSLNNDLSAKIEEMKLLTDRLRDKEVKIEILQDNVNSYHNEIACLKEQLKLVSRSPSPRNKSLEGIKTPDRQANDDRKQLVKIKKQISLLQHELEFNKKELNDKAFELAKAKLDITELKNSLRHATKRDGDNNQLIAKTQDMQNEMETLRNEKENLTRQLDSLMARLREESNIGELKEKLRRKVERCRDARVITMARCLCVETAGRGGRGRSGTRAPPRPSWSVRCAASWTRRGLWTTTWSRYCQAVVMTPKMKFLASHSIHQMSSTSERIHRVRAENDKLQLQVEHLQARLRDKDALIHELNCIREQLRTESEAARLRLTAESDTGARLQLLSKIQVR